MSPGLGAAVATFSALALIGLQDQQPGRPGWPCTGRPDPSYFKIAEGSGGQFFLFHPSEAGASGALVAAAMSHGATVLRAGGQLAAGLHEFAVPVDRVDSLLFSLSVQCLQVAEIVHPSGALLQAADPRVEFHQYEAGRIVTIAKPDPGQWRVRISGTRLFLVTVQAKAQLRVEEPRFVPGGPLHAGEARVLRFSAGTDARDVYARLVTQGFADIAEVPVRIVRDESGEEFLGEITTPARPFRVAVTGRDAEGLAFQRVHAALLDPAPAKSK